LADASVILDLVSERRVSGIDAATSMKPEPVQNSLARPMSLRLPCRASFDKLRMRTDNAIAPISNLQILTQAAPRVLILSLSKDAQPSNLT
jgi:hypothetical protein